MLNIDESESINLESDRNEFLDDCMIYETCPYCQRTFFQGKLSYHLKLCNANHPMYKTPKKKTRLGQQIDKQISKQGCFDRKVPINNNYQRCQHCDTKLPSFLMEKHVIKCQLNLKQIKQSPILTKIQFSNISKKSYELPQIRKSAGSTNRKNIQFSKYNVRIREDLRCMKIAMEVQKVNCQSCGRKFSNEAALRHIPICQIRRANEEKSIGIKKKSKSLFLRKKSLEQKKKQIIIKDKMDGIGDQINNVGILKQQQLQFNK